MESTKMIVLLPSGEERIVSLDPESAYTVNQLLQQYHGNLGQKRDDGRKPAQNNRQSPFESSSTQSPLPVNTSRIKGKPAEETELSKFIVLLPNGEKKLASLDPKKTSCVDQLLQQPLRQERDEQAGPAHDNRHSPVESASVPKPSVPLKISQIEQKSAKQMESTVLSPDGKEKLIRPGATFTTNQLRPQQVEHLRQMYSQQTRPVTDNRKSPAEFSPTLNPSLSLSTSHIMKRPVEQTKSNLIVLLPDGREKMMSLDPSITDTIYQLLQQSGIPIESRAPVEKIVESNSTRKGIFKSASNEPQPKTDQEQQQNSQEVTYKRPSRKRTYKP